MTDRGAPPARHGDDERARAQAEVVGYLLVFSVVVLTVALVTVSGQAGLVELRDTQRTANVEAGFGALAENVDDVTLEGVPSRATELKLSGESLGLGDPVTVRVRAVDGGTTVFDRSTRLRPLVYRGADGERLVYAAGAVVIRGEGGGVAMLREPRFVLGSERTVVPVANVSLDRQRLRGVAERVDSESRVLVRTERRGGRAVATADRPVTVTVSVTSPRAAAWERYLDAELDGVTDCRTGGDTVTCSYDTDRASVVVTPVVVGFE